MSVNDAPSNRLRESIRREARRLGLDDVGFTTAEALPHADTLRDWLDEGRAGAMSYLEDHGPRHDPARLLEGARSLIAAAVRYPKDPDPASPIAAYAQRPDYHHVLRGRLHQLADHLRELVPASRTRVTVDTAPLFEREVAMRAGLGWIGRSTMLVHPKFGCYTLLGEVLWTEALPPDPPATDQCGTCRRCIDACPTGAIEDRSLDPRKCLSYWTIEQREAIPETFREPQGTRAFGCDACLDACPFGRDEVFQESELLPSDPFLRNAKLGELLEQATRRFHKVFGASPVERARKRGLLRSLFVAIANAGQRELAPRLRPYLGDDDPVLREHATWALRRLGEDVDARPTSGPDPA